LGDEDVKEMKIIRAKYIKPVFRSMRYKVMRYKVWMIKEVLKKGEELNREGRRAD